MTVNASSEAARSSRLGLLPSHLRMRPLEWSLGTQSNPLRFPLAGEGGRSLNDEGTLV